LLDPENVGVAVEISFLCAIEAELHMFYAVFAWSYIYYLLPFISGSIRNRAIELLDPEDVW